MLRVIHQSVPTSPYLTPWTVLSVSVLSLALTLIALRAGPESAFGSSSQRLSRSVVFCFAAVFLLEYACGIRVPDLDLFFLPDSSGQRVTLYAARPSPQSAITSLLFAVALIVYPPGRSWRKRAYQVFMLGRTGFADAGRFRYIFLACFSRHLALLHEIGLSLPAIVLYFTLGSGVLGLSFASKVPKPAITARPKSRRLVRRCGLASGPVVSRTGWREQKHRITND